MSKSKHITLTEYQRLYIGEGGDARGQGISKKQFEALEAFVLKNEAAGYGNYLKLGHTKGLGKVLQAQNYIGVIQLHDGLTIEILPKIANLDDGKHVDEVRKIVVKMLKTLRDSPFKEVNTADLQVQKMPLLEVFIGMFLQGVAKLVQRGIKNDYITREENSPFLKGKLLFAEHLKRNLVHKERFFIAYDNYLPDRDENRLIKTTLSFLYKLSKSSSNQQRIREFLFVFDEVEVVHDIKTAFSKVKLNRQMKDYEQLMIWCRLFLLGNSFAPSKGNDVAFSLLFDMNVLFESYVGHYLKKHCTGQVSLQDKGHYLACQGNVGKFALKPDIVIDGGTTIADTKWRLLSEDKLNVGISQGDVYQMYAYATKYQEEGRKCEQIFLIYPKTERTEKIDTSYCFKGVGLDKDVPLNIVFFDLQKGEFKDGNGLLGGQHAYRVCITLTKP